MHWKMNSMGKSILLILFLFSVSFGLAQESGSIQGHITDGELQDEPLLFAQVSLKNTAFTTETNFHGNFELNNIEPGDYILTIDYLGYESVEVPVTVKNDLLTIVDRGLEVKKAGAVEITAYENSTKTASTSTLITSGSD